MWNLPQHLSVLYSRKSIYIISGLCGIIAILLIIHSTIAQNRLSREIIEYYFIQAQLDEIVQRKTASEIEEIIDKKFSNKILNANIILKISNKMINKAELSNLLSSRYMMYKSIPAISEAFYVNTISVFKKNGTTKDLLNLQMKYVKSTNLLVQEARAEINLYTGKTDQYYNEIEKIIASQNNLPQGMKSRFGEIAYIAYNQDVT